MEVLFNSESKKIIAQYVILIAICEIVDPPAYHALENPQNEPRCRFRNPAPTRCKLCVRTDGDDTVFNQPAH
jgi:hypothetical protein